VRLELLEALNAARAAKRRACLLRYLATDQQSLVVDGQVVAGESMAEEDLAAVEQALRHDHNATVRTHRGPTFLQVFNPPLRLVIVGAVHIAQALAPMAALAGYAVTVVDPRRGFATDARFPDVALLNEWPDDALETLHLDRRSAVVTLTHDPKIDDPALDTALRSDCFYVAALGSRRTHAGRLERLGRHGHDATTLARIHGPAGLDIGAESPAEIAIAILAQMTAVLRRAG
jgi:xanthine dehydrogenase accessory factor